VRGLAVPEHHPCDCGDDGNSMSVQVVDPFFAALLLYLGYWLFQLDMDCDTRESTMHFEIPPWRHDELWESYNSDEGQSLSDIRRYVQSLKRLQHLQKFARHNQDGKWVDPAWVAGKRNKEAEEKNYV
jgi:hypothetical protein